MELEIKYTDKPITPYAGLTMVQRLYKQCGFQELLDSLELPQPGSNRGYRPQDIVEGLLISIILGSRRLAHSGLLRHDATISEIFGWRKGMASESTFSRFLSKFSIELNDKIFTQANRFWFSKLLMDKYTVDIDSTVITRYGTQEGVEVGYNPKKRGRGSHHPIIAFAAEPKMVIQSWLRTGDSASSTDFNEFLDLVLQTLPPKNIGLIRADSGFFSDETIGYMESKQVRYIVAAKMYSTLAQQIFDEASWCRHSDGIDTASIYYKAQGWKKSRRVVVVRKLKEKYPKSGGKTLFQDYEEFSQYLYSAFVTDIEFSDKIIWDIYRHRAESETQIRELKENYGLEGFCCEKFEATEAAFRWACIAYNLMSLFKIAMLNQKHNPTLTTLKFQCIAIAGYLIKRSRKKTLVLAAKGKRRDFLEQLFQKIELIDKKTNFLPNRKFLMN